MAVQHDDRASEYRGIHHPGSDLASDAGKLFEPVHRLVRAHRFEMRQIHRSAQFDEGEQTSLQPFGRHARIGLGRQFIAQFVEGRSSDRFPTAPASQHPVGRRVGHFGFGPRADDALHQYPFRRARIVVRPLDPPEPLDQQWVEPFENVGSGIAGEGQFHRADRHVRMSGSGAPTPLHAVAACPVTWQERTASHSARRSRRISRRASTVRGLRRWDIRQCGRLRRMHWDCLREIPE